MYTSYSCIDASTEEYQEEEGYSQEEEENFDHYPAQGKLTLLQSPKCKALQEQGTLTLYFMSYQPIPCFYLAIILLNVFQSLLLIYDSLGLE